uniref:Uncharacterized protein n=1 Tax=Panagrolaimus davidi TaxID=227884 RepID=A0A914QI57_9BILA
MNNEFAVVNHRTFGNNMDHQEIEENHASTELSEMKMVDDDAGEERTKANLNETHNLENGIADEDKEVQQFFVNIFDASSSNTMALLAATYSPTGTSKTAEDVTYVTLDDHDEDIHTVSTLSSEAGTSLNGQKSNVFDLPTKKVSKKKTRRQRAKDLNQKKAEQRERLKLEGKKQLELRLDDLIEPIKKEADILSTAESTPEAQLINTSEEDGGYVKAGYSLRRGKRPPKYDSETLREWSAMQEERRLLREQQKALDFKEEMKKIELRRQQKSKAKKVKAKEKTPENGETLSLAFLNAISESIDNNSDDVKILKVVTKPKKKKKETSSSSLITLTPKPRISLDAAKKRNKLRVIQPISSKPKPTPIVCLPSSSIRRAPLHTLPLFTPRKSIIHFPKPVIPQESQKTTFTDDCFTSVQCSNPTTPNIITVPPPPVYSTTSKRVQMKKQAAKLNSSYDEDTVFDECFSTVPCSPPATMPSSFQQESTFATKRPSNVTSTMKPTTVSSEASAPITDDCFTSIPCGPSTNANGIDFQHSTFTVPVSSQPTLIPQFSTLSSSSTASISAPITDDCFTSIPCGPSINANGIDIQHSTFTVPISSQPTLIPQFSTLSSSSAASISAPLQLTQQVQTITIPSNCFPTDGTPLQIVLILPNSTNNNSNVSSPVIIQTQPLLTSSSPPTNDAKVVEVKCEMKE